MGLRTDAPAYQPEPLPLPVVTSREEFHVMIFNNTAKIGIIFDPSTFHILKIYEEGLLHYANMVSDVPVIVGDKLIRINDVALTSGDQYNEFVAQSSMVKLTLQRETHVQCTSAWGAHTDNSWEAAWPPAPVAVGPAVLSVKKSNSAGCARIELRDAEFADRCVRQSVAIIDGCCVEIRRHAKPSGDGTENPGIFVAWGRKVQKKITISEHCLEQYFNALAESPTYASSLAPESPLVEETMCFPLFSGVKELPELSLDVSVTEAVDSEFLSGAFCEPEIVKELWEAKGSLDTLWNLPPPPLARGLLPRVARAQLFPHSGKEGREHENRAGAKLETLASFVGLLEKVPANSAFLDLCGGPGAWSQFLLDHQQLSLKGFGFTLKMDAGESEDWKAEDRDQWYPDLTTRKDWKALWGVDGTGDLLKPGNIEHTVKAMRNHKVFFCIADGGFSDHAIPPNALELYFYRLFLAEVLMAASCLEAGGRFVCKLYSTLSVQSQGLLYLCTRLFDSVAVVKPRCSRITGPERYLTCFGFRAHDGATKQIVAALAASHAFGAGRSPLTTPLLTPIVPPAALQADTHYMALAQTMASTLCDRQAKALRAVVDRSMFFEHMATEIATSLGFSVVRSQKLALASLLEDAVEDEEKYLSDEHIAVSRGKNDRSHRRHQLEHHHRSEKKAWAATGEQTWDSYDATESRAQSTASAAGHGRVQRRGRRGTQETRCPGGTDAILDRRGRHRRGHAGEPRAQNWASA